MKNVFALLTELSIIVGREGKEIPHVEKSLAMLDCDICQRNKKNKVGYECRVQRVHYCKLKLKKTIRLDLL